VIGAAVPILILAVFFTSLAWPHIRAIRVEAGSRKVVRPKQSINRVEPAKPLLANRPGPADDAARSRTDAGIEQLIQSYLKADYGERYKYVCNGTRLKDQMAMYYAEAPPFRASIDSITFDDINQVRDDAAIATTNMKAGNSWRRGKCYVRKVEGRWLVDWPATIGLNPITLKAFQATAPNNRTILRVNAELSDLYISDRYWNAKTTHFSIQLSDRRGDSIHGYVERRSTLGRELYELLKDGKQHEITVAVQCTGIEGSVAEIVSLISRNWLLD
jgi:hypothetical protein